MRKLFAKVDHWFPHYNRPDIIVILEACVRAIPNIESHENENKAMGQVSNYFLPCLWNQEKK